jgi:hypothetical protein
MFKTILARDQINLLNSIQNNLKNPQITKNNNLQQPKAIETNNKEQQRINLSKLASSQETKKIDEANTLKHTGTVSFRPEHIDLGLAKRSSTEQMLISGGGLSMFFLSYLGGVGVKKLAKLIASKPGEARSGKSANASIHKLLTSKKPNNREVGKVLNINTNSLEAKSKSEKEAYDCYYNFDFPVLNDHHDCSSDTNKFTYLKSDLKSKDLKKSYLDKKNSVEPEPSKDDEIDLNQNSDSVAELEKLAESYKNDPDYQQL